MENPNPVAVLSQQGENLLLPGTKETNKHTLGAMIQEGTALLGTSRHCCQKQAPHLSRRSSMTPVPQHLLSLLLTSAS